MAITQLPDNQHVTYQLQYRKCGKPACGTCRNGLGHGPYWYAYWREGSRLRSGYIGKVHPMEQSCTPLMQSNSNTPSLLPEEERTPVMV